MGRIFKVIFVLLLLTFVGIQFIEVDRKNFPTTGDIKVSVDVKGILKKSCMIVIPMKQNGHSIVMLHLFHG